MKEIPNTGHQCRDLDIFHGFKLGQDIHICWKIKEAINDLKEEFKRETDKIERERLAHTTYCYENLYQTLTSRTVGWYCLYCGFLLNEEVTNNEHCSRCDSKLP